jgi:hypothetical protein
MLQWPKPIENQDQTWVHQEKEEVLAVETLNLTKTGSLDICTHLSGQLHGYCRALFIFNPQRAYNCVCIGFQATHFEALVNTG